MRRTVPTPCVRDWWVPAWDAGKDVPSDPIVTTVLYSVAHHHEVQFGRCLANYLQAVGREVDAVLDEPATRSGEVVILL